MADWTLITPQPRDLGEGFMVRRALPSLERRAVGHFVLLDEFGPAVFAPGQGLDVRPHPHIGLATVTYVFDGAIDHRDSLGTVQTIRPGAVNWMTAGRGIVHSERSPQPRDGGRLHGIQFWVALPLEQEEADPAFIHCPAEDIPEWREDGVVARLLIGAAKGRAAPIAGFRGLFYVDLQFEAGGRFVLPDPPGEAAVYCAEGAAGVDGAGLVPAGALAARAGPGPIVIEAQAPGRAILFGGEPLDAPRRLWWNFVSARAERIDQARQDWETGRFDPVPGETERIPAPHH